MPIIVIADDTPTELALLTGVVTRMGHSVETATDGQSCIDAVKRVKPALILMDVVMPGMDGYKACRTLKKDPATAGIPVIMVTTKDQESDRFWGERQGAVAYVTKPFTPESLMTAIQRFVA